jgi:8-oxo-dGTP pyrophosphatase MutT (NUDIX family)
MPYRPDIVAVWAFRIPDPHQQDSLEILLIRRAPGRELAGLWQCVTGSIEPDERIVQAAVRELAEETGLASDAIEAFYDLDLTIGFHWPGADAILTEVAFAARVRPDAEPTLSSEHDGYRWVPPAEAMAAVVWPTYRSAIERIATILPDADRAAWLQIDLEGRRRIP